MVTFCPLQRSHSKGRALGLPLSNALVRQAEILAELQRLSRRWKHTALVHGTNRAQKESALKKFFAVPEQIPVHERINSPAESDVCRWIARDAPRV